jgi:hypothetical protein
MSFFLLQDSCYLFDPFDQYDPCDSFDPFDQYDQCDQCDQCTRPQKINCCNKLLYTFVHHFCNDRFVNNILTHTKQFAFHAPITTGVYSVGFDVFRYLSRRSF